MAINGKSLSPNLKRATLLLRPRKKQPSLKYLALLPKRRLKSPSSPDEAKKWLADVAKYLSRLPNASPRFRFVAFAIRKFLRSRGKLRLSDALGLLPRKDSKRGRPPVSADKVRAISKMLTEKADVSTIVMALPVSKTTVQRTRADYRAVTWDAPLSKLAPNEELHDIEAQDAEVRERKVPKARRDAIILG